MAAMRIPRAGVVVTGTEVLTARVRDANGPWLAERLQELGVELQHITICRDRASDLRAQLEFLAREGVDLIITTGGLGPTADDLTTAEVASFCGREMVLDPVLEERIAQIVAPLLERFGEIDQTALHAGTRKQATIPAGAKVLGPAGTAPGVIVTRKRTRKPTVVVLPGPPRELREMWPEVVAAAEFRSAIGEPAAREHRMLRLFGMPESEIAETLRVFAQMEPGLERLEVTTCLRGGEVEVAVAFDGAAEPIYAAFSALVAERHPKQLFSLDGATVDQQVTDLLGVRGLAVAESCTGGMLAARLTDSPGASDFFLGGAVAYANAAKTEVLGVPPDLIERCGAVSGEVAAAMAEGALDRFGSAFAVSVTGIAGPGGGSAEKPVGTVCICALAAEGARLSRELRLFGDRADIRERATAVAMHMLRRLLLGERD